MTKSSSFHVCLVRLVVMTGLVGLILAASASNGRASFIYAFSQKVTSPPNGTGPADDFDIVLDTGTLATGGASNEAPNIVAPKGGKQNGPFMSLLSQTIKGQPTQALAHFTGGGNAAASTTYTFAFGLKQKQDVKVSFVSANWTANGTNLKPTVAVAGFSAPLTGKDQQLNLFDDTSVSFDLVNVSVLVDSPELDLSTLDPGNAPGFTAATTDSIPLGDPIPLGSGQMASFNAPGTVTPGDWAYIQGFIFDPSVGQIVDSFIYGDSVQVPEPPDLILLVTGLIVMGFWRMKIRLGFNTSRPLSWLSAVQNGNMPVREHVSIRPRPRTDGAESAGASAVRQ